MSTAARFELQHVGDVTVVKLFVQSLFDTGQTWEIETQLAHLVEAGYRKVVVDLQHVPSISAALVGSLLRLRRNVMATASAGSQEDAASGRRPVFEIYPDQQAAIQAWTQVPAARGGVLLCGVRPEVQEVLKICRLVQT